VHWVALHWLQVQPSVQRWLQETRGWRRVDGAWSYSKGSTHPYIYA
jgi:hypothetical protein